MDSDDENKNLDVRKMVSAHNRKKKKSGGFQSMGLSYPVFKGILRKGYKIPTPIQRKTIPLLMDGKDVVAMARTGSGKTAAFLIPMFEKLHTHNSKGARALILSPTRELAMQTMKFTKEIGKYTGLKSTCILGGDRIEDQFAAVHQNPDIIIATPGRFLHLIVEMELKLQTIEYTVFDEADRLFEMGFAEQLHEIIRRLPDSRQTLLFSATLPKLLIDFTRAGLADPVLIRLDVDTKISDKLKMSFFSIRTEDKLALLLHILQNVIKHNEQTVVFVATKHHVEYVTAILQKAGIECSFIYSALDQTARKINVAKFQKKRTLVLVVTDVAARGIDIPMLDNVINFDFPAKPKLFVHRVGRVARAGRSGTAYSFVTNDELAYMLDLHLFLGRPVSMADEATSEDKDGVYGTVPRNCLDVEEEYLVKIHDESHDLVSAKQVMLNACKQYIRSRPAASSESIKRSKEMVHNEMTIHPLLLARIKGLESNRNKVLEDLKKFKPTQTIFEIRGTKKSSDTALVMKTKRSYHGNVIERNKIRVAEIRQTYEIKNVHENEQTESGIVVKDPKSKRKTQGYKDENYIPHKSSDSHTEKGLTVTSFEKDAAGLSVDMVADDAVEMRRETQKKQWDRKRKKFVGPKDGKSTKKIKTESGAWISASYKTNKYQDWIKRSHVDDNRNASDEEEDNRKGIGGKRKGKGRSGPKGKGRQEMKSKDQILKLRMKKKNIESRLKNHRKPKKGGMSKGKK